MDPRRPLAAALGALAVGLGACAEPAAGRGAGAACDAERACDGWLLCLDGRCVERPPAPTAAPESIPPLAWPDVLTSAPDAPDAPDAPADAAADAADEAADGADVPGETRLVLGPHDALLDPSDTRLGLAGGQAAVREVALPSAAEVLGVEAVVRAPDGTSGGCGRYDVVLWVPDSQGAFPIAPTHRSATLQAVAAADPVRLDLAARVPLPAGRVRYGLAYVGPCEASFPPWLGLDASGDTSDTFVWANAWIPGATLALDGRWGLSLAVALP